MPSPAINTGVGLNPRTISTLVRGVVSEYTRGIPSSWATDSAVGATSPVTMAMVTTSCFLSRSMVSAALSLKGSASTITPASRSSVETYTAVSPARSSVLSSSPTASWTKAGLPTRTRVPSARVPSTPLVATSSAEKISGRDNPCRRAWATIGSAKTCTEYCSAAAAMRRVSSAESAPGRTSTTPGSPRVRVPVLSKAAERTRAKVSRVPPSLTITFDRAAELMPPMNATGAAISSGQGVATTSTSAKRVGSPLRYQASPAINSDTTVKGTA